jgi:hypothetical protein
MFLLPLGIHTMIFATDSRETTWTASTPKWLFSRMAAPVDWRRRDADEQPEETPIPH